MNAEPEISLILPAHNVDKYLGDCIESVIAQTFTNFELLVIDDGSTDKTPAICDEFARRDERIFVIHQEKAGVSAARNAALDRVRGRWIGFVDGDDLCDPALFQVLYENAVRADADISICGFNEFSDNDANIAHFELNPRLQIFDSTSAILEMLEFDSFGGYSWNKLVKASLFHTTKIRYDTNILTMSDVFLFYNLFKCSKKIVYSPVKLYNYRQIKTSIVHESGLQKRLTGLSVFNAIFSQDAEKTIKKKAFMRKIDYASRMCYEEIAQYNNELYAKFRKTAVSHIFYLLFCVPISLKSKLSRWLCILFPKIFMTLQKLYRGNK